MVNKNRGKKGCHFGEPNYWQSSDYNRRTRLMFEEWILQLAINRFRWVGLPDTCDVRVLEWALHTGGQAAICKPSGDDMPPVWFSLPSVLDGELNVYGVPTGWRCNGVANGTHFRSDWDNGAWVWYSKSQFGVWNAIQLFSTRLTHLVRTEDINLFHQQTPMLITAPDNFKRDAENAFKQIAGGEPAIIANKTFEDIEIKAISTEQPYIGLDLNVALQNMWNSVYRFLGIEHLAFEKGERMIEEEARGNTYPTALMLLDCLDARREACAYLNENFGLDVQVYFNSDVESYNFNFLGDIERLANAGIIGNEQPIDRDNDGVVNEEPKDDEPTPNRGGIIDTKNFYKTTSIIKDYAAGRITLGVAQTMLGSLGIDPEQIAELLERD